MDLQTFKNVKVSITLNFQRDSPTGTIAKAKAFFSSKEAASGTGSSKPWQQEHAIPYKICHKPMIQKPFIFNEELKELTNYTSKSGG